MRVLVLVLTLLAAAKIGTQQYLIASAKTDIIVSAYRDRAVGACREAARSRQLAVPASWSTQGPVRLVIGKSNLDVALWQVDHNLWQKRYKNPYLIFTISEAPLRIYCEFDIAHGAASLITM
jgi:hypothetical protein